MLLECTMKYRTDTENEAKDMIEKFREDAKQKGYIIKKIGYEYKTKKSKGQIIAEAYVVTIIQVFGSIWEELENG